MSQIVKPEPKYKKGQLVRIVGGPRANVPAIVNLVGHCRRIEEVYPGTSAPYKLEMISTLFMEIELHPADIVSGPSAQAEAMKKAFANNNVVPITNRDKYQRLDSGPQSKIYHVDKDGKVVKEEPSNAAAIHTQKITEARLKSEALIAKMNAAVDGVDDDEEVPFVVVTTTPVGVIDFLDRIKEA